MSQNFKLRSDEIEENDIGNDSRNVDNEQRRMYATDGHVRNISFVLPNGEKQFLNYAYLVSGKCSIGDDFITLKFTSETVTLQGLRLNDLYYDLMFQHPMEISSIEARYNATENQSLPIVNDIKITD